MTTRRRFIPVAFEEGVAVACMAVLVVITMGNVVIRYFTDESFAWTEEISVFLLVLMTLAGASAAAARNKHIRIEYFYDSGPAGRRRTLRVLSACITGLLFAVLTVLFLRMVYDEFHFNETSMGLGVPRWWFTAFSPILCGLIAWRSFALAWAASEPNDAAGEPPDARNDPR